MGYDSPHPNNDDDDNGKIIFEIGNMFLCNRSTKLNKYFHTHTQICSTQPTQVSFKSSQPFIFTLDVMSNVIRRLRLAVHWKRKPANWNSAESVRSLFVRIRPFTACSADAIRVLSWRCLKIYVICTRFWKGEKSGLVKFYQKDKRLVNFLIWSDLQEDESQYFGYFCMKQHTFEYILRKVHQLKKYSNFRETISPEERLAETLR